MVGCEIGYSELTETTMSSGSTNPEVTSAETAPETTLETDTNLTEQAGQEASAPGTSNTTDSAQASTKEEAVADAAPASTPPESASPESESEPEPPQPAVASQPAQAQPEAAEAQLAPPADEPKRTVELKPAQDLSQLRAVGSVDAVEQPELIGAGPTSLSAAPPQPSGPIDIPDVDDLDADIEAQIEAAMSSPESEPAAPVPAAGDGEEATGLDESGLPVEGTRLKGTVQSVDGDNVFLDVGLRVSAVVTLRQFPQDKQPSAGDTIEVVVEGTDGDDSLITTNLPSGTRRIAGNWDDLAAGQVVECLVTKTNKGGLEVTVSNLRGFLPASQIDLGYIEDTEVFVGQKLRVQVTEVNKKKRNLVLSRRVLLQAEREAAGAEFWQQIAEGQTYTGTVKTLKDYGAFINIGPVDGFLHIGEISWSRVSHPRDVLMEGQTIEVKVIKVDHDKKRIGLGMRQLSQNPWLVATEKYAADRTVSGTVTRVADFGAFVELEPGIEGLVHISELAWRRVKSTADVLSVGQTEEFKVLEVDANRKRISLSLKQTQEKPESAKPEPRAEEAPAEARPVRQSPKNLKGGTGSSSGGGLFGNPSDFT